MPNSFKDTLNPARRRIGLLLSLSLLLWTTLAAAAAPRGGIRGQVVAAADNLPIEGVKIIINGKQFMTNSDGNFAGEGLLAGDYLVHTYSNRFLNAVVPVRIDAIENTSLTIKLKIRVTKLEGFVVDEEGRPVIGVEIYTYPEIDETKTDEKGYFMFDKKRVLDEARKPIGEEGIPPGEYNVFAQKLQYTKAEKKLTIIPGLSNSIGTLTINKIGVALPEGEKKELESPQTIDEPIEGMGEVKLD